MISNATPIICLAKINQLELLKKLFGSVIIPQSVKEEILIKEKPGFLTIQKALEEDWLKIINPEKNPNLEIGIGENAVINLAKERNDKTILDDAFAIKVAKAFGIDFIRTTTVIFMTFKKKIISKEQTVDIINKLIDVGYYIAPRHYASLITKLNTL